MLKNLIEGNSREFAIRDTNNRKIAIETFAKAMINNSEDKVYRTYHLSGVPEVRDFGEFKDTICAEARKKLDETNKEFVEQSQRTERERDILRKRLKDAHGETYDVDDLIDKSQPDGSVPAECFTSASASASAATGTAPAAPAAPADTTPAATGDAAATPAPVCSGFAIRAMKGTAFLSEAQVSRINENLELYDMGLPKGFRVVIAAGDKIVGPVTNKSIITENIGKAIAEAMMPAKKKAAAATTKKAAVATTKKASSSSKASEPKKTKK